jgi:hypothetical protein
LSRFGSILEPTGGFGGHFATNRRHSTTLGGAASVRIAYVIRRRRGGTLTLDAWSRPGDDQAAVVVATWRYVGFPLPVDRGGMVGRPGSRSRPEAAMHRQGGAEDDNNDRMLDAGKSTITGDGQADDRAGGRRPAGHVGALRPPAYRGAPYRLRQGWPACPAGHDRLEAFITAGRVEGHLSSVAALPPLERPPIHRCRLLGGVSPLRCRGR